MFRFLHNDGVGNTDQSICRKQLEKLETYLISHFICMHKRYTEAGKKFVWSSTEEKPRSESVCSQFPLEHLLILQAQMLSKTSTDSKD